MTRSYVGAATVFAVGGSIGDCLLAAPRAATAAVCPIQWITSLIARIESGELSRGLEPRVAHRFAATHRDRAKESA